MAATFENKAVKALARKLVSDMIHQKRRSITGLANFKNIRPAEKAMAAADLEIDIEALEAALKVLDAAKVAAPSKKAGTP